MYSISKFDILTINYTKPRLLKWPVQPRSKPGLSMARYAGMWSALLASGHGFVTCSLQFGEIKWLLVYNVCTPFQVPTDVFWSNAMILQNVILLLLC